MTETAYLTPETADISELKLYSGIEFFEQLAIDVSRTKAGDRVAILTMSFEPDEPLVAKVIDELHLAADRDVEIAFGVDAYTFLVDDSSKSIGPLLVRHMPFRQATFNRRQEAIDRLASKPSVDCTIVNSPSRQLTNPYAGRSHIKTAVVNDKAYIGGPNFHKSDRADLVVGLEDPETADRLYTMTRHIVETGKTDEVLGVQDWAWQIDGATKVIVDAGRRKQSLIRDMALRVIENAQESVIGSFQFFPNGELADSLIRAHNRQVKVRFAHNRPLERGVLLGSVEYLTMMRQKRRMPEAFFADQAPRGMTMHGSAITNEQSAMVGSHNFVQRGVGFGTPELVLSRDSPAFAREVGNFILSQIQKSEDVVPFR